MEELERQQKIEEYRYKCQVNLEKYKYDLESTLENFKTVIAMGQTAIKGGFLSNGAALIALMAFIANGWRGGLFILPIHDLAGGAMKFVLGLGFALAAQGMSYLAQYTFGAKAGESSPMGNAIEGLSVTLAAGSYVFWVWGGLAVWRVIEAIV
jgi:hypothetical protein